MINIYDSDYSYVYNMTSNDEKYEYTLVNDNMYITYNDSVYCLDSIEQHTWSHIISNSNYTLFQKVDPIVDDEWYSCPNGQLYSHRYIDTNFLLCYTSRPLFISGVNFKLSILSIEPITHELYLGSQNYTKTCSDHGNNTSNITNTYKGLSSLLRGIDKNNVVNNVVKSTSSLLVGEHVSTQFWLEKPLHQRKLNTIAKNPNICFIHGMGITNPGTFVANTYNLSSFSSYWKGINTYFPYSSGFKSFYWSMNTIDLSWKSQSLLQETLNWIISTRCHQIYAHSMGNLIMLAINHRIGIDLTITDANKLILTNIFNPSIKVDNNFIIRWNAMAAPFKGSWSGLYNKQICESSWAPVSPYYLIMYMWGKCINYKSTNSILSVIPNPTDCAYGACTTITSRCELSVWGSYELSKDHVCYSSWLYNNYSPKCCKSGDIMYPSVKRATIPMSRLITSKVCGTTTNGLSTLESIGLAAVSSLVRYGDLTGDDGMVAFSSCATDEEIRSVNTVFGTSYTNKWYKSEMNHADIAGYFLDGTKDTAKPGMWMNGRIFDNDVNGRVAFTLL